MIGIGKIESSDSEQSDLSDSQNKGSPNQTKNESKSSLHHYKDEVEYFVTIQIEETFLQWLDDPEFIEPIDVLQNLESLCHNPIFLQQCLKKEICLRKKNHNRKTSTKSTSSYQKNISSLNIETKQEKIIEVSDEDFSSESSGGTPFEFNEVWLQFYKSHQENTKFECFSQILNCQ